MNKILLIALIFLLNLNADTLFGKVVKIIDGDTIHILDSSKRRHKIRLFGIDAPEKKQAYGNRAKNYLSGLIAGRVVKVEYNSLDRYKRILGVVFLEELDINAKMVSDGYAWAFVKYSDKYINEEIQAKKNHNGLWSDRNAIEPWKFRKKR